MPKTKTKEEMVLERVAPFIPRLYFPGRTNRLLKTAADGTLVLTFKSLLAAIASSETTLKGRPIAENVVAKFQKVARDGIDDHQDKIRAILELLVALLQSRHIVRSGFQVDSPYGIGDVDKAILLKTPALTTEALDDIKESLPDAFSQLDYRVPANVLAYVRAINTHGQDSYNSATRERYPRVRASYNGWEPEEDGVDPYIRITLLIEETPDVSIRNVISFRQLPAYFTGYFKEQRPFIDVIRALLELTPEGGAAELRRGTLESLREWAAVAVATSALFSRETHTTTEVRLHAAFVDMGS